jgi:hypothetical protein
MDNAAKILGPVQNPSYARSALAATDGANALLIATEWSEFKGTSPQDHLPAYPTLIKNG